MNKIIFYRVWIELVDGRYFTVDYVDYDDAISYYNGTKENNRIKYIDVSKVESNESGLIEPTEIVASYQ